MIGGHRVAAAAVRYGFGCACHAAEWSIRYLLVKSRVVQSSSSFSLGFMGGVSHIIMRKHSAEGTTTSSTPRQLSSSAVPKENHVHNALAAVKNNVPAMRCVHCRCDNPMKVLLPYLQWFTVAYSGDAGSRLALGKGATASQLLVACCSPLFPSYASMAGEQAVLLLEQSKCQLFLDGKRQNVAKISLLVRSLRWGI